jgi:hypothetical protein
MSYFTCSIDKHQNNLTAFYSRTVRLLFLYKQLPYELLTQHKNVSHNSWCQQIFVINVSLAVCVHINTGLHLSVHAIDFTQYLYIEALTANSKHNSCLFPWMMLYCPCISTIYSTHTLTPVLTHSGNLPRACLRYSLDSLNKGPLLYTS